jgi:hypothetical protein
VNEAKLNRLNAEQAQEIAEVLRRVEKLKERCDLILRRHAETGEVFRFDLMMVAANGAEVGDHYEYITELDKAITREMCEQATA